MKFIGLDVKNIDIDYDTTVKELIIKDCSELVEISANGCKLEKLIIENCPNLRTISAYGNNIEELILNDFPDLIRCFIPFNRLRKLEIKDCEELSTLFCNDNNLKELDVSELIQLKKLHCNRNMIAELDCRNLAAIKELYAQENELKEIKLKVHNWLTQLDLAENQLTYLDISRCKKLVVLSCRDNLLTDLDLTNNTQLVAFAMSNNFFPPTDVQKLSHLKKLERLTIGTYLPNDIDESSRLVMLNKYWKYNIWYGSLEAFKDSKLITLRCSETDIDSGLEYLPETFRMFLYDSFIPTRKVKELGKKWEEKYQTDEGYGTSENTRPTSPEPTELQEPEQDKPVSMADYTAPFDKDTIINETIAGERLTGKLVIEDWPLLKSLNVGDNQLVELEIRNCPNLKTLIYSHNRIKKLTIEGCPNLTTKYSFDSDGYVLPNDVDPIEKAFIELERLKRDNAERVRKILANPDDYSLDDILALSFRNLEGVSKELREQFAELAQKKLELLKPKLSVENSLENKVKKIGELIVKARKTLTENNLDELEKILEEIEKYCGTSAYNDNRTIIRNLQQELRNNQKLLETSEDKPLNYPLFFGTLLGVIGLLLTLLMIKLNKVIKTYFLLFV